MVNMLNKLRSLVLAAVFALAAPAFSSTVQEDINASKSCSTEANDVVAKLEECAPFDPSLPISEETYVFDDPVPFIESVSDRYGALENVRCFDCSEGSFGYQVVYGKYRSSQEVFYTCSKERAFERSRLCVYDSDDPKTRQVCQADAGNCEEPIQGANMQYSLYELGAISGSGYLYKTDNWVWFMERFDFNRRSATQVTSFTCDNHAIEISGWAGGNTIYACSVRSGLEMFWAISGCREGTPGTSDFTLRQRRRSESCNEIRPLRLRVVPSFQRITSSAVTTFNSCLQKIENERNKCEIDVLKKQNRIMENRLKALERSINPTPND